MNNEQIKKFLNKKVKLILNNGFRYSGKITTINDSSIEFYDKFGNFIAIENTTIELITTDGGKFQ